MMGSSTVYASEKALVLPLLTILGLVLFAAATSVGFDSLGTSGSLTVLVIFAATNVLVQFAQWKTPLWGKIGHSLDDRQRLDLHRAMAQSALWAGLVPIGCLLFGWMRGAQAEIAALLELGCLAVAIGAAASWFHHRAGLAYLGSIDDGRKRLSYAVGGWRFATALNLVLHLALWGFVWLHYSGGPSLFSDIQAYFSTPGPVLALVGLIAAALCAGIGQSPSLRRLLGAHTISVGATTLAMLEVIASLRSGGSPVPIALSWSGIGILLSAPWAGHEKGMFKPVGEIRLRVPPTLATSDRLRLLAAASVLLACWSNARLPSIDLAAVILGVGLLTWSRIRRQRLEYLLSGQTRQLRKDKERVEELNQILAESFSKFVPRDLVEELVAEGQLNRLRGEEREVSILFSDIRGYSTIIETLPPIRVLKVLNLYFDAMETVIERHGGTILEYVGDAILAVFGAPGDLEDHARAATQCALEMREALAEFNAEMERQGLSDTWRTQGFRDLGARIGVHKGHVVAGTLGGTNQVRYSVLGDTVNVAARLEAYNKELGTEILISDAVFDALGDEFVVEATDHGPILLKGRSAEQHCYSL